MQFGKKMAKAELRHKTKEAHFYSGAFDVFFAGASGTDGRNKADGADKADATSGTYNYRFHDYTKPYARL